MRGGRASFEQIFAERLRQHGVGCTRLSDAQLIKGIVDPKRDKIAGMFLSFIQNVKRRQLDSHALNEAIRNEQRERVKVFHELALRVFSEYCQDMKQTKRIDFDDLLSLAAHAVRQSSGDLSIRGKNWHLQLNEIKWILVDEYQDFSPLFFDMVKALKEQNQDCSVLCVGDDWQAINSFAGSDLKYFQQFEGYFGEAGRSHITINRRSGRDIIKYSNQLMQGRGEPAKCDRDADQGEVRKLDIKNPEIAYVEFRQEQIRDDHRDWRFLWFWDEKTNKVDLSRQNASKFLKVCYEIIREHAGKSFFIISRRKDVDYYVDSDEFMRKLKRCFSKEELKRVGSFEEKVKQMTAHKTKGLEADIVLVLDVCRGVFPLLHPDHALSEIFGVTPHHILEEERRLLYVAMTRAREKTYFVTDSSNPSDFLKEMNLQPL
jgi:DNA helicase-4